MWRSVILALLAWMRCIHVGLAGQYGVRVDPWLTKEKQSAVKLQSGQVIRLRLLAGDLEVTSEDGQGLSPSAEEVEELLSLFPEDVRRPPVPAEIWLANEQASAMAVTPRNPLCPVTGENHFEKTIVDAFRMLGVQPHGVMMNIGGLYGGRNGDGMDYPDDPVVELLRVLPKARVICWGCDDVSAITRVGADLAPRFEAPAVDVWDLVDIPPGDRELDLLRLDTVPLGQSCQLLGQLLRKGVRPRLLAIYVLSQVPPPLQLVPIAHSTRRHPAALTACSLAAVAALVGRYGLSLVRLTGPYALFAETAVWPETLPLNDLDCYRRADIYGHDDIPADFVRDWLFSSTENALWRVWSNISSLYSEAGLPNAPFTLAV